jgi:hypothetical protein
MRRINPILSTQSLIYFLVCGGGILVFILLIIIPTQQTSAELDNDIEKLQVRIDEQRVLNPIFDKLLMQVKKESPTNLPTIKKVKLARGGISKISEQLLGMARRCELNVRDIQTDVNAMKTDDKYLRIHVHATGEFLKFRKFLMDLGRIPSLEQIEEIHMRAIEAGREFRVKVRLAQQ